MKDLSEWYEDESKIVVTSHRGFSGRYPENTLTAFRRAVEIGTDLIEFDLRGTADHVPVILHDPTVDRSYSGVGPIGGYTLEQAKALWYTGKNADPETELSIPTFSEALDAIPSTAGLNIQVKETTPPLLENICRLYQSRGLKGRGYLTLSTFDDARRVREIDQTIDICILERRQPLTPSLLQKMADFGCRFCQPHRRDLTPELCEAIKKIGLCGNVFYSNTDEDNRKFIEYGIGGIMTDRPDILLKTLKELDS